MRSPSVATVTSSTVTSVVVMMFPCDRMMPLWISDFVLQKRYRLPAHQQPNMEAGLRFSHSGSW